MKYGTVYKITNKLNGKSYVGITTKSIHERFQAHLDRSVKSRSAIQKAIKKYGKENFIIEELDSALNKTELYEKEVYWIAKLDTFNCYGYNLTIGGGGITEMSQEIRDKISKTKSGKSIPKLKGRVIKKDQRIKISRSLGASIVKCTNIDTNEFFYLDYPTQGKEYGFNPSLICAVIKGKRNHHKGFIFEYVNYANPSLITETKESVAVQRIDSETVKTEYNLSKRLQPLNTKGEKIC
jgi:group I intron endonuclease